VRARDLGMENALLLVLSVAVTAYLLFALLRPEKF
jgi:K+-transporting ATPase KdpF subunit